MSVELPKDAEGREIPLDTVALFGGNGNAYNITCWMYVTDFDQSNSAAGQWRAFTDKGRRLDPELMYFTSPDSWEKLEEDVQRSGTGSSSWFCIYAGHGKNDDNCYIDCKFFGSSRPCEEQATEDIVSRIRKLRSGSSTS